VTTPDPPSSGSIRTIAIVAGAIVLCGAAYAVTAGSSTPSASTAPATTTKTVQSSESKSAFRAVAPGAEDRPLPDDFTGADHSRTGLAAYNSGDIATAEAKLKSAVEADGQNAEALNNLGQILVRAGKAQEAVQYFDRAIALSGDVWAYRFNRARAFAEMKDWANAIAGYTDALGLFPTDYATHFNLAKAREASGDLPGAVESYGKAAELAPGQADFQLWYGRALDRAGRQQDAVAAYKRFLELEPSAPQAEKVRARLAQLGASTGDSSSRSS
jgi:tetratricopeptide (TPR) repeat protein